MKKVIIITIILIANIWGAVAQEKTGIHFEQKLDWPEILAKAKTERKYIFVDCYATWCGPCKQLDANIYPLKQVGDIYNQQFICLKLQMDQTPLDNDATKHWYGMADIFTRNYTVTSYPTFLFFDPDGKPAHKVSGAFSPEDFIRLASDAQNPEKQYYSILKAFRPGKLDTSELKGLARSFFYSDKELAVKLALDYLARIPHEQLGLNDNRDLMILFQENPQVLQIAVDEIKKLGKMEFIQKENAGFVVRLSKQPQVKTLAIDYITKVDNDEFGRDTNLDFAEYFSKDSVIVKRAKSFINQLYEQQLYTKPILWFIETFTEGSIDQGFDVFFHHADKVDSVMQTKGFARNVVDRVIYKEEITPSLDKAKKDSTFSPDWVKITARIEKKYGKSYVSYDIIRGKTSWYHFKKDWKNYTKYLVEKLEKEEVKNLPKDIYTGAYLNQNAMEIFYYSKDKKELKKAITWSDLAISLISKPSINAGNAANVGHSMDTKASLLYKLGKKDEALALEKEAVRLSAKWGKEEQDNYEKMKKGLPTWVN